MDNVVVIGAGPTGLAAACGLRPVYYKNRKPEYVRL